MAFIAASIFAHSALTPYEISQSQNLFAPRPIQHAERISIARACRDLPWVHRMQG